MLVLTRRKNESILIGDDVEVVVVAIQGDKVRLGIEAPREITVLRRELKERKEGISMSKTKIVNGYEIKPFADLRGANLSEANLRGANLSGANLSRAHLSEADLREADLRWANLSEANLRGANLRWADLSRVDLSWADLSRADLSRADLSRANLRGANLSGAHLSEADLREADLRGANLSEANLRGANLSGANLSRANLRGADLSRAHLREADLSRADLSWADLSRADLSEADLSRANGLPTAPVIPNIDATILAAIETVGGTLDMGTWHTCETTHCRAGWAIHLAGEAGYALEKKTSSYLAGRLIYEASRPGIACPDFFANNKDAFEDLRKCAKESA